MSGLALKRTVTFSIKGMFFMSQRKISFIYAVLITEAPNVTAVSQPWPPFTGEEAAEYKVKNCCHSFVSIWSDVALYRVSFIYGLQKLMIGL